MKQLANKYDHREVESNKYDNWISKGYFTAGDLTKKPYCIVIPPPNVTGMLHIGHAYNTTIQDVLARYKRLQGFDVLWLPGMDHAGIATQAKVEKKLQDQGINKYDIGREEFLKVAWQWKKDYADTIHSQWAKMGLSLDYSREAFTLDEKRNEAVRKVFVTLYEKGYIYRKKKIINWDPVLKTALSNIEVIYKEIEGKMYYFRYYVENSDKYIIVGTTRPETMFGDVAVVVNPKDERYQWLKNKKLVNPANGELLEVIFDPYVDINFATGAMKCTPAHDPNDYNLGIKYNLPQIICMNLDATMNEKAGKYVNLDRFKCRELLVKELEEKGLVEKIEKHIHQVGHSERSNTIVEPTLSMQWFVAMKKLAKNSLDKQKSSEGVKFYPQRFEKIFVNWMENIEDWCISRQLWWGHRIPAYYHKQTGEVLVSYEPPKDIENYVQDEDVLDTWFSSALWPFATLGWPDENSPDFKRYYPNDLLVTAYDIIFFWVSRMMFQALEFTHKMPFKDVLIHGLIRDEQGRKMSKSLGNGIDPLKVIDQYGADALRFFLTTNSAPGLDFRFSNEKISASWNFINKIWNATRFVLMNLPHDFEIKNFDDNKMTLADRYILAKLHLATKMISENMEKYEFANVGTHLTNFIWDDFCSWYIEMSKLSLLDELKADNTRQVLYFVLKSIIILLEPFTPFVAEELYLSLPKAKESINLESWPKLSDSYYDENVIREMNEIIFVISSIRNLRNTQNIPNSKNIDIKIYAKSDKSYHYYLDNIEYLSKFSHATFKIYKDAIIDEKATIIPLNDGEMFVNVNDAIDFEKELEKLTIELKKWTSEVLRCQNILSNNNFLVKAPAAKIDAEKNKLKDYLSKKESVEKHISELEMRLKNK